MSYPSCSAEENDTIERIHAAMQESEEHVDAMKQEDETLAEFLLLFDPNASRAENSPSASPSRPHVASTMSLRTLLQKRESSSAQSSNSSPDEKRTKYSLYNLLDSSPPGVKREGCTGAPSPVADSGVGVKKWTEKAVEEVLSSQTNPIGKFLRDLGVGAADAIRLNIMPHLNEAPRKPRTGYGKRKHLLPTDRKALSRERNREHARSTRQRRKIFESVLDQQLHRLGQAICSSFTPDHTTQYLHRRNRRVENLVGLFLLMDSNISTDTPVSWQYCLSSEILTCVQLQSLLNVQERQQPRPTFASDGTVDPVQNFYSSRGGLGGAPGHSQSQSQSQGTGGGPMQRLSLVADLSPPLSTSPGTATWEPSPPSHIAAAAFFGLPLSLVHLPSSPSGMMLLPVPICGSYSGYESLERIMKRVLEALQQAVYHVLLTDSFYHRVFNLLVPDASSLASPPWSTSPLPSSAWSRSPPEVSTLANKAIPQAPLSAPSPPLASGPHPKQLFFSSPLKAFHSREGKSDTEVNPLLKREHILCYPPSLKSPCRTQDSSFSSNCVDACDADAAVDADRCGAADGCDDRSDEADSLRTLFKKDAVCPPSVQPTDTSPPEALSNGTPVSALAECASSSESPDLNLHMPRHPPTFTLQHLIPVGLKFLISFSKNDLLVQGTEAMCSFDLEVKTSVPPVSGDFTAGKGDDEGSTESNSTPAPSIATTLVSTSGAFASFCFESDVRGGSKVREASFDLDIDAVALDFLDHVQILHEYFGRGVDEDTIVEDCSDKSGGVRDRARSHVNDTELKCDKISTV